MHKIISRTGSGLGLVDYSSFQVLQTLLGVTQTQAQALTNLANLLASGTCRCAQLLLGIGDHDLEIGNQLFLVGNTHLFGHVLTSWVVS